MSYKSHLEHELKLLPPNHFKPEELASMDICIDASSKDGGGAGNLFVLRGILDAYVRSEWCDMEVAREEEDLPALEIPDFITELNLDKPIYAELVKYTLPTMAKIVNALIHVVTFRPLTDLQGTPDEWLDHGHMKQNIRWGQVFKDGDRSYWLERFNLRWPSPWTEFDRWTGHRRRGDISFPFNNNAEPINVTYTDETRRMRIVRDAKPDRQFIVQTAFLAAAGQPLDPLVFSATEEINPDLAKSIIDTTFALWGKYTAKFAEPTYDYEVHYQLLHDLRWAMEYEGVQPEPSVVTVADISVPYTLLPHVRRAVTQIPLNVSVTETGWKCRSLETKGGEFKAIPVRHIAPDYSGWVDTELVSIRWVDDLSNDTYVCHVHQSPGQLLIVAGDESDWLYRTREALGIVHPKRELVPDGGDVPEQCCESVDDYTTPAEPIDPEA